MKFIFTDGKTEMTLPITPPSFTIPYGNRIETINIHELGDVNLSGYGTLPSIRIDCQFPAHDYPFAEPEANTSDPYYYVKQLQRWIDEKAVIRFIVSETPVNIQCLIEEVEYGEQDGTGDVLASIMLRGYRELTVAAVAGAVENTVRTVEAPAATVKTHTVVKGDTLSAICRKYYGDASLYPQLASYNKLKNANVIKIGQVLQLPDKDVLKGTKITSALTMPGKVKQYTDAYITYYTLYTGSLPDGY